MGPGLGGQDETGDDRLWPDVRDRIDELETCEAGPMAGRMGCGSKWQQRTRQTRRDCH
jgi:hypothetical protein